MKRPLVRKNRITGMWYIETEEMSYGPFRTQQRAYAVARRWVWFRGGRCE